MTFHDPLQIVGTVIDDKYSIESVVGEGGFGVVYRAEHRLWKQPVAIKCFKTLTDVPLDQRNKVLADFVQEGALLTQLSGRSASIVQARDVGTFTTKTGAWVPYLVLEWLEGSTLEGILETNRAQGSTAPWPLALAMRVLEPVATALDLVHRKGIAHRDVKPANIFIVGNLDDAEMHVKVLDFGIAKVMQSVADKGSYSKTAGNITAFTPAYGAPEQFSRKMGATGPWTDVFALALILSELLSGQPALAGDDFLQLGMSAADPRSRPTPRALGVAVSDRLEAVMQKALAIEPQHRYPTAGEFWNALRSAQDMAVMRTLDPRVSGALAQTQLSDPPLAHPGTFTSPAVSSTTREPPAEALPRRAASATPGIVVGACVLAVAAGGWLFKRSWPGAPAATSSAQTPSVPPPPAEPSASAVAVRACPPEMASIPGGKFFMGSDEKDATDEEKPAHQVTLSAYCIDLKETTTDEYRACSEVGECKRAPTDVEWRGISPKEKALFSTLCNARDASKGNHPINCVDWEMATQYCSWKKRRLPSEAEWEFAARGPDGRTYPWGDEAPDGTRMNACGKECVLWHSKNGVSLSPTGKGMYPEDDGFPATAPVGSYPLGRSRFGLFDVVGNVWEWTADWEGPYAADAVRDPQGTEQGTRRVVRGGAFNGIYPSWVHPSRRYSDEPRTHSHAYGFRCAANF